jgi:hypothetical protein
MTNSQRLATVRARLIQWLADRREPGESPAGPENPIVRESILIRGEYYCGRRFHTVDYQAVWFIEEDELKIYRSSGELECVLSGEQISNHAAEVIDAAEGHEPPPQGTQAPGSPAVIKMPSPVEANVEANVDANDDANDDSDDQIRRAA